MERLPGRRRRRSLSAASSPSSGPSRSSARSTPHPDEPLRKRRRRDGETLGYAAGSHRGHVVTGNDARGQAHVQYGDQHGDTHNHYHRDRSPTPGPSGTSGQEVATQAMEALSFVQMDVRRDTISKHHLNTCKWLFDRPEYTNWRCPDSVLEHYGFMWIKSKPGAGKSTLMKFLLQSAKTRFPDDVVVSFFFNARGETLEKSLEGFYRGLLHQLFTAIPRLQNVLASLKPAGIPHQSWPLGLLKTLLSDALLALGHDRVTCFIDALDECPETEIRDMIEFFEELGESTAAENINLRICFSSRHYPQVSIAKCQHMVLDGQEGHESDIAKFVRSKLKVRKGKTADEVRTAVQDKAQGVFMWVVLVVRILNEENDHGKSNAELRRCLDRIPSKLHDLFQDILQRGIQDNKRLVPILQWISFAQRPLTREELYFAIRSGEPDCMPWQPWDPEEDDPEAMDLFILNSSKGLAEMTRGQKPTVQFIHESVRDYLHETGFKALAPQLVENLLGLTHHYLEQCCLAYVDDKILKYLAPPRPLPRAKSEEAKALRQRASTSFPFLKYAVGNLIFHAELACGIGTSQLVFVRGLPIDDWLTLSDILAMHDTRRYSNVGATTTATVFAQNGARNLLEADVGQNARLLPQDEWLKALGLAVSSSHTDVVSYLLKNHAFLGLTDKARGNLLTQALKLKDTTILATLLENDVFVPGDSNITSVLLAQASFVDNTKAIGMLSDHGADIVRQGGSALISAARGGRATVVKALIQLHAPMEISLATTALIEATNEGYADIVRMLLEAGANVNLGPFDGKTALHSAGKRGHETILCMLLAYGAQPDQSDSAGRTPLMEASGAGHTQIMQLLLDYGANINSASSDGHTPLTFACTATYHNPRVVQLLLDKGANPDPIGEASAAWCALARPGYLALNSILVKLLLDHGADCEAKCPDSQVLPNSRFIQKNHFLHLEPLVSRSLMFGASLLGHPDILKALFENGADANVSEGKDYHDALSHACRKDREQIVQILLSNGGKVESQDVEFYREVVFDAALHHRSQILTLLFHDGQGFKAQRPSVYAGSLRLATDRGYHDIVEILSERGVKLPEDVVSCDSTQGPPSPSERFYCR